MFFASNLLRGFKNTAKLCSFASRNFSCADVELDVPTFCDVRISVPVNVAVSALDVHKYHNCDKLLIKVHDPDRTKVQYFRDGNKITIVGEASKSSRGSFEIKAPIKANLKVLTSKGDIHVGFFNGDKLTATSTDGNILIDKYQGDEINVSTKNGDITLKGVVQASDIKLTTDCGSISTSRLQGIELYAKTRHGNISTESSYCTNSYFDVTKGELKLNNIHKRCDIYIRESGVLNMLGFDGSLNAVIERGNADIQLAQILEDSEILIKERGDLTLRLSDFCCENVAFEITSRVHFMNNMIKMSKIKKDDTVFLNPNGEASTKLKVLCQNGAVNLLASSWTQMMETKLDKQITG